MAVRWSNGEKRLLDGAGPCDYMGPMAMDTLDLTNPIICVNSRPATANLDVF